MRPVFELVKAPKSEDFTGKLITTASDQRLSALSEKLEAEKAARAKQGNLTVMGFFWLLLIFAAFGLIGNIWDIGFAYAMELKFVKGQGWLAGAVFVFAAMAIGGLFVYLWESIAEGKQKRPRPKRVYQR